MRWIIATCIVASTAAHANTWHVSVNGNDNNPGTQAAPWRTPQRAATAVAPGDTVVIHAGTYAGFLVTKRGTETAPIAFTSDGAVTIEGSLGTDRDAVHIEGAAWIRIEGLTVQHATRAGISALDCDHITVRGNKVDSNGRWGVFSSFCDDLVVENNEVSRSGTEHGVYASNSADRPVIRGNTIWGNGMCGVHMNGDINFGGDGVISGAIVENNIIRGNGALGGSAINGDGVTGAVIRNNVLDDNHASGVSLYMEDGGAPSSGNRIVNNTIRMASNARWAINIQNGATGNIVRNNVLLHPNAARGAIDLCTGCTVISNNNAVVGRFSIAGTLVDLPTWRQRTGNDAASFVATDGQLFTSTTDLTLKADSKAIDKGVATDAPLTDIDGVARPQGAAIDIGAYERCDGACLDDGGGDGSGSGSGNGSGGGSDYSGDNDQPPADEMSQAGGCSAGQSAPTLWIALGLLAMRQGRRRLTQQSTYRR